MGSRDCAPAWCMAKACRHITDYRLVPVESGALGFVPAIRCRAFPNGVPGEIIAGEVPHLTLRGDEDGDPVVFEAADPADVQRLIDMNDERKEQER